MQQKRHGGLQAARGIAALLVLAHHMPWATNRLVSSDVHIPDLMLGGAGVTLFFVLSGYVMAHLVNHDPRRFIVDRLRRIFPALWVALILSSSISWMTGGQFPFGWEPFILYPVGEARFPWVPYWTLHYEMAFYLLMGFALLVAKRPLLLVVGALALSYALATRPFVWVETAFPTADELVFSSYALLFMLGVILGWTPRPKSNLSATALLVAGTVLYFWPVLARVGVMPAVPELLYNTGNFPHLVRGMGAFLALLAALRWDGEGTASRFLSKIGDASYGIYLTHIAFAMLAAWLLSKTPASTWTFWPALIAVSVISLTLSFGFGLLEWSLQKRLKSVRLPFYTGRKQGLAPLPS